MSMQGAAYNRRLGLRAAWGAFWHLVFFLSTLIGVAMLFVLLVTIFVRGSGTLDWQFIVNVPSRFPELAGIKTALVGTIWVIGLTGLFSVPIGVGTAVYLEEYAPRSWMTRLIQTNISNLAGVPSIVYGILGLFLFVRLMALDRSVLAGALTMTLLILPIIIIVAQEAIRAVPDSLRQASYALGITRWQTVRYVVLPAAFPGILTGTNLAIARALGETAPLLMIGALTFIAFSPASPLDPFTVLPIQIFSWTSRPQEEFRDVAAGAIIVLLGVLLTMNGLSVYLRSKYQRRSED